MREIQAEAISQTVKELFLKANYYIGKDILAKLNEMKAVEASEIGKNILDQIIRNDEIAGNEQIALCQDTGMAVLFIELGQEVYIAGGAFEDAIFDGVRAAYADGYLRKSVVSDPIFDRTNTKDNTPAIIHLKIVPGDQIKIAVTPKGFGSENMSAMRMLKPADGEQGVREFIVETVIKAGPNPCPPIVVGVGIGGTSEMAAIIAKKATMRPVGQSNLDERYAKLESEVLKAINNSGIGPGGLGGNTTALTVNIDWFPTHIAGMPVVVNICCHAARHAEAII